MEENEQRQETSLKLMKKKKRGEKRVGGESKRVSPWIERKEERVFVALSLVFCFLYFRALPLPFSVLYLFCSLFFLVIISFSLYNVHVLLNEKKQKRWNKLADCFGLKHFILRLLQTKTL